ncbi:hypothetical protein [Streptomyces vietnamensis]|uniref:hypothetical protein n=1 Tax=Streptomyces vietnamensis TaxID=362257 RepID=UPI00343E22EF
MRGKNALRRLTVHDTVWLWRLGNVHPGCTTYLALHRSGAPDARLRLVFRDEPGRITAGFPMGSGEVAAVDGGHLNLNEPGVVRRLLDLATERALLPYENGVREEDGWPLFDELTRTKGN